MPITKAAALRYSPSTKDDDDNQADLKGQKPRLIKVPVSGIILLVLIAYLCFVGNRNYVKYYYLDLGSRKTS